MTWREVVYEYDGSFDGLLCCIYESYTQKELPAAFFRTGELEPCLYEVRAVTTDAAHARRVYEGFRRFSPEVGPFLRRAYWTCLPEKELAIYRFAAKLYREGKPLLQRLSDETYHPLLRAVRQLNGELEQYRGFVRFSDIGGVLAAEIEPKNRVLPLLRQHFCDRYANEAFFIYDRTHKELLVYAKRHSRILPMDSLQLALPSDEEVAFRRLWKRFYEAIAIKERYNPRCQNTFMPKRYRGTMTEFLPDDYEARQQDVNPPAASGAFPAPDAPAGISAPVTHPRSGPSAPVSGP